MWRLLALAVAALALGACGQTSSAADFEGEQKAVAEVVEDIQSAASGDDAARICRDLLADELIRAFEQGAGKCTDELDKAISDVDDFELDVEEVTVTGTTATARVVSAGGAEDRTDTLSFTKQQGRWKATSLGGS